MKSGSALAEVNLLINYYPVSRESYVEGGFIATVVVVYDHHTNGLCCFREQG